MNLLLRDFDSKEVAENVAAEILKRGVAKSAQVTDTRGDLAAAQECLAGLWPLLNVIKEEVKHIPRGADAEVREIIQAIETAQKDCAKLYERAMGDT